MVLPCTRCGSPTITEGAHDFAAITPTERRSRRRRRNRQRASKPSVPDAADGPELWPLGKTADIPLVPTECPLRAHADGRTG
eukprot:1402091-Prorocentrum_lima.AAC.1